MGKRETRNKQDYDHDDHGNPLHHPHDENGGHLHDWENGVRGPAHLIEGDTSAIVQGVLLMVVSVVGCVVIAADDATVVGAVDDGLLAPLASLFMKGLELFAVGR